MTEAFLYYIWQHQYYNKRNLRSTRGEEISVVAAGILNHDGGPDFSNASIRVDKVMWLGTVEIHTRSSDWNLHGHSSDGAYENVILHVVWEHDKEVVRSDGTFMPTLVLSDRIGESLVRDYRKLIHNPFTIPCTQSFPDVNDLVKHSMIDRALLQRLEIKAAEVMTLLKTNCEDWEETTWQLLARNFGFKINADTFLQLSRSVPYRIVLKLFDKPLQVEALLFGQAGFLDVEVGDEYYRTLLAEYKALSHKHRLEATRLKRAQWKFLRLRPSNFPTVRLAQFSALVAKRTKLFSKIIDAPSPAALVSLLEAQQSTYWQTHFRFNKKAKATVPELGKSSIENILINTVVPLLMAWGIFSDDQKFTERATDLLEFLPPENNVITREWTQLGYVPTSAFDSQGLIELYNGFCRRRNCLNCVIGASVLKPDSEL